MLLKVTPVKKQKKREIIFHNLMLLKVTPVTKKKNEKNIS